MSGLADNASEPNHQREHGRKRDDHQCAYNVGDIPHLTDCNPSNRRASEAKSQYYPEDEIQAESMGLKLRPDDLTDPAPWEVCQCCGVDIPHDCGVFGGPDVGTLCDDCGEGWWDESCSNCGDESTT